MQLAASVDDRIEPKPFKSELLTVTIPWFMRLLKMAFSSSKARYDFFCLQPQTSNSRRLNFELIFIHY